MASDQESLIDLSGGILASVRSCNLAVAPDSEGADASLINVYFNNEVIKYDEDCSRGVGWM